MNQASLKHYGHSEMRGNPQHCWARGIHLHKNCGFTG